MSGVAIIRTLLAAHQPVLNLVPADRICAGVVRQGTQLPAVGITEVSCTELPTVAGPGGRSLVRERVQVTVHGTNYSEQKALLRAAGLGQGVHTGTVAGLRVKSVLRDIEGADLGDPEAGIYQQSRDFIVTYTINN